MVQPNVKVLAINAPVGTYNVDAHAELLVPNASHEVAVEVVRFDVNRAATVAVFRAEQERVDLRNARHMALSLVKLLAKLDQARKDAKIIPDSSDGAVIADLATGFASSEADVVTPLMRVMEDLNSLRSWSAELRKFDIASPPPSSSEPLSRAFIEMMGRAYVARLDKQPPKSRVGPFVNLLAAAWLDLGFPTPEPRKIVGAGADTTEQRLKDWLGPKVERLPLLTANEAVQGR
jgi:hypothetical protein